MTLAVLKRTAVILALCAAALTARSADTLPLALATFDPSEPSLTDISTQARERLGQQLAKLNGIVLVDTARLDQALAQNNITASSAGTRTATAKIGELTGAKIVISGQILDSGGICYLIVKVSAVDTPRIFTATTEHPGFDDLDAHVTELTAKIADILKNHPAAFTPAEK